MKSQLAVSIVVLGSLVGAPFLAAPLDAADRARAAESLTLADVAAGKARVIDLTYALNEHTPHWPGPGYFSLQLKTIATFEKNGVLSKSFCMPEHLGTHLDAPSHFERGQPDVSKVAPDRFFAEGVVIDVGPQAAADPEYRLSMKDVERWEGEHGSIPDGAIVLLNTGWGAFWNNTPRYMNQDAFGKMHFPGYSAEAARFLVERRKVKGMGIDTLSMDYGPSRDYPVHHIVNGAGRYGLENIANLNLLPPRGFFLVVAPIKIETGTGGPTRIFAILPK